MSNPPEEPSSIAYNHTEIEPRWQQFWRDDHTYEVDNDDPRPHYYVLCMYPYPSGAAHMGHVRNYTFGDLITRYRTMRGHAVLSPMGFDSFGLPAENAAIKTGVHPREFTDARIEELRSSFVRIGGGYDWRREVKSHDPEYIRWTQWIFLKFYEAGLVYRRMAPVNWDPVDQTVLANEQVLPDGTARSVGRRRGTDRSRAVVLQDHRLRPAAARRPRDRRVAPAGGHPAAQLDRSVRGRRVRHGRDRRRRRRDGRLVPGLHDPPRHQLRHDLLRARPRAPAGRRRSPPTIADPTSRRSSTSPR